MGRKKDTKVSTGVILFIMVPLILGLFIVVAYCLSNSTKDISIKLESSDKDMGVRGSIITKDGFAVANSQKLYKVTIDTRSIDKDKLDLFVKLYSIYTNDSETRVKNLIKEVDGDVVLSYEIDAKNAMHLRELARKLNRKKVFVSFLTKSNKTHPPIGMSIIESGENREYLAKDSLSPILGHTVKQEINGKTKVRGKKGVEQFYNYYLSSLKDGLLKGPRDIGNNIILDKDSQKSKRIDGYNVVLNIPLKFQKELEGLLSQKAELYDAKEIIAGVINSKTGEILTLATSLRYNPSNIRKKDYPALNLTATEYSYEAGSVVKPIVFSIIYENKKVKLTDIVNTHNGIYQLGKSTIRDTHQQAQMSAADVIVYSSNIGMVELSSRIDGQTLYDGLINYNFSRKTDIDVDEKEGNIKTAGELDSQTYKGTTSYGYGLQVTFIQLLNAYTVFNNDGVMISPRIVNSLEKDGKKYIINNPQKRQIITKESAKAVKDVLIQTVKRGTGKKALTAGVEVGGKTGTARIAAQTGGYSRVYNSSFFGFANDENASYTIGVLVIEPKKGSYYAAQNALPIFKDIVDLMIENGYLKPKATEEKINLNPAELDNIKD
ncbi:peptidoglycan D,D-transpeptidase FtsI family protein [Campylobacter geochelonis]|uniref:peptidoglycan D,D-transpeptidase FtsI family protein n=1 Tax=Campylobacter geochelonis TaxID=1780362 RepID=UPI000770937D|nr:penicillin-binding protein 2 [Campylobacter geochelonis]CZE47513.1 penicillin-binding protein [Campylobacter geochelonis]CZE50235.1 penicillin-binding protein [Campylobacter geochelonis]